MKMKIDWRSCVSGSKLGTLHFWQNTTWEVSKVKHRASKTATLQETILVQQVVNGSQYDCMQKFAEANEQDIGCLCVCLLWELCCVVLFQIARPSGSFFVFCDTNCRVSRLFVLFLFLSKNVSYEDILAVFSRTPNLFFFFFLFFLFT